jgi:hypothetical protein
LRGCAPEALGGHLNGTVPVFPTVSNFSLVPPQFTTVVRSFNFGWIAEFVQKYQFRRELTADMGCTASRRPFVVNSKVEGQDQAALNVLTELGLSQPDIDLLYTAFWDMDADSSGTIQPIELFAYFEVESATFEKGVFCLFDEGNFFPRCCKHHVRVTVITTLQTEAG